MKGGCEFGSCYSKATTASATGEEWTVQISPTRHLVTIRHLTDCQSRISRNFQKDRVYAQLHSSNLAAVLVKDGVAEKKGKGFEVTVKAIETYCFLASPQLPL